MASLFDSDEAAVVVLSSQPQAGNGWLRVSHSCGGFSCDIFEGYAYILPVLPEMRSVIDAIADERFCEGDGNMDYGVETAHRESYRAFLARHGLSVNDANLRALTQAIYPFDASEMNLQRLTGAHAVGGIETDGLMLAVIGFNCD